MIKFKSLIKENPDTVYYKKKMYSYRSPSNRCAFFIYKDKLSGKQSTFGYSDNKKEFYCDDPSVLTDIKDLKSGKQIKYPQNGNFKSVDESDLYSAQQSIKNLNGKNNGGGHLELETVLHGLKRWEGDDDYILKGRIFEVDEATGSEPNKPNLDIKIESTIPTGKSIIVTFWSSKNKVIPYKDQIGEVIKFNGYKPEECLYELYSDVMTFDELYNKEEPKPAQQVVVKPDVGTKDFKPHPRGAKASDFFKVGDKVKVKGLKIAGDVISIDGNNVTIRITDNQLKVRDSDIAKGYEIGSEKAFYYGFLEPDNTPAGLSLEKVIDDKTQEFVEKRGKLHTTGAKFTPAEKANLEKEVDSLEIELKILNDLLNSGIKTYTDNVKSVVTTSVQRKLHAQEKEKLDRYSLAAQAEKQYGMPIAQIRQKFRGIPLDQLVKKESLYKKLLKALL